MISIRVVLTFRLLIAITRFTVDLNTFNIEHIQIISIVTELVNRLVQKNNELPTKGLRKKSYPFFLSFQPYLILYSY